MSEHALLTPLRQAARPGQTQARRTTGRCLGGFGVVSPAALHAIAVLLLNPGRKKLDSSVLVGQYLCVRTRESW